jgi:hypothetical protein
VLDTASGFASESLLLIPDSVTTLTDGSVVWTFSALGVTVCVSGCWVDPPTAPAFSYSMSNSALFTGIADFPSGFGTALEVKVGGTSLGTFGPGDSVDFTTYPGGGIDKFEISGISPEADLTSAEGFSLALVFDSAGAEFTMTSNAEIPVPLLGWPGRLGVVALLMSTGVLAFNRLESRFHTSGTRIK